MCSKCNVHGDWNILERLVKKAKVESSIKDFIEKCKEQAELFQKDWQQIVKDSIPLSKLNDTELLEIFKLFEFPVSFSLSYCICLIFFHHTITQCLRCVLSGCKHSTTKNCYHHR